MRPRPSDRVRLFRPLISEAAIAAVGDVLRSGWVGLGPRTREFEEAFAARVAAPHCVAVDSGTAALHLALRVLNIPPDAEVITTAMTFIATNAAILYVGARPVFADIDRTTGNVDPGSIADHLTERTRAIVAVHYAGYPCDLDELYDDANMAGVPLIEDCAHAIGASYRGRQIGSHGNLHAFSFAAIKNLPVGAGGAITLSSAEEDRRLRRLRSLGAERDPAGMRIEPDANGESDVTELGYRCAMNDVSAAVGLAQLALLEAENARRAAIAGHYRKRLATVPGVTLLRQDMDRSSSNWLFSLLAENRDELVKKLDAAGIETGVHFRRNDDYRIFERAELPATEWFSLRQLSLPMHLRLTDDDIDYVCDVIAAGW